ncbi:hypothetical protein BC831DRAFT_452610, partial [Entophlyctis helioformis]
MPRAPATPPTDTLFPPQAAWHLPSRLQRHSIHRASMSPITPLASISTAIRDSGSSAPRYTANCHHQQAHMAAEEQHHHGLGPLTQAVKQATKQATPSACMSSNHSCCLARWLPCSLVLLCMTGTAPPNPTHIKMVKGNRLFLCSTCLELVTDILLWPSGLCFWGDWSGSCLSPVAHLGL